jgi:hypothetical protein
MAERIDQAFFEAAIAELRGLRIDAANILISDRLKHLCSWRLSLSHEEKSGVVLFSVTGNHRDLYINEATCQLANRLIPVLPLIAAIRENGAMRISLGDCGIGPGAAFCDFRPEYLLIPDAEFLATQGYEWSRRTYAQKNTPWSHRKRVAFWRGSSTGHAPNGNWRSLPRVILCEIAKLNDDLFDVGINKVTQFSDLTIAELMDSEGMLADTVPDTRFDEFRYHIDIDGNTNAWSALFRKLLSGSPVLKVASPMGFRQWYYDRLTPWMNFVPVSADMSDLVDKVRWLMAHDDHACCIGNAGRELALALDYDGEVRRAAKDLGAALKELGAPSEVADRGT